MFLSLSTMGFHCFVFRKIAPGIVPTQLTTHKIHIFSGADPDELSESTDQQFAPRHMLIYMDSVVQYLNMWCIH